MNTEEFKKLRKSSGLTQHEVAKAAGVSLRTIQNYEDGKVIPKTKYEILQKVLGFDRVNESATIYEISPNNCKVKLESLIKELEYKDQIIELLKEKIDLINEAHKNE